MGQNFGRPRNDEVFFIGRVTSGKVTLMPISDGNVTYSQATLSIPQPVISSLHQPLRDGVSLSNNKISDGGDDMEKRLAVLEAEVSHIKGDISEIKSTVSSINTTVNTLDKNMAVVLEKLSGIKEAIDKKPSSSDVDKKISDAKLAILLGVPAIIGIAAAIIKWVQPYLTA